MRLAMFYHSLRSDWNHGNAHFLRGIVDELLFRGHEVRVFEPRNNWSLRNLRQEHGQTPLRQFRKAYPRLASTFYNPAKLNLKQALDGVDLVIVHEWNDHELVHRIGEYRAHHACHLLFHDTHHRAVTDPSSIARYDLRHFDGVLAFGQVLRDLYLKNRWTRRAWIWHEAADTRLFRPVANQPCEGDLVWIGNWGDNERAAELNEFLLEPARTLRLKAKIHGVRYPRQALRALHRAGIRYAGWLPNFQVPEVFARHLFTVHVPRRPYVRALPGIPTIRVFEALACGIPLVCSPWNDAEGLFTAGKDYLVAQDGQQMQRHLRTLLHEPQLRHQLAAAGHRTILCRHTCAHRVDELLNIYQDISGNLPSAAVPPTAHASRSPSPHPTGATNARK